MEKIGMLEKKEILGGFATAKAKVATTTAAAVTTTPPPVKEAVKSVAKQVNKMNNKAPAVNPFFHRYSLVAMSIVPGILSMGEGLFSLISKLQNNNSHSCQNACPRYRGGYYSGYNYGYRNNRNDYFAYASESFKPIVRFAPYPSKTNLSLSLPWAY